MSRLVVKAELDQLVSCPNGRIYYVKEYDSWIKCEDFNAYYNDGAEGIRRRDLELKR